MQRVLVVGGRTTGLMMALELARRGIPIRCIDQSPGIDPHVRGNLLHSRTLEIFQGLGIDKDISVGSVQEKGFALYRDGTYVGDNPHAPVDPPFPYGLSQSQAHTEATVEASLNSFGVEVERSVSLASLDVDDDGAVVVLRHSDGREETESFDWVVGCDGAHSAVRHHLGVTFPGEADATPYVLGDVFVDGGDDLAPEKGHVFFHGDGTLYLFTRLPKNRQFIVASLQKGASIDGMPTLEDLQAIVTERSGRTLVLRDPKWLGHFRINYRQADHYRRGRAFLAGDAAHVHSLLGGQGMNIGIQDAHNLAWKLALVARQEAHISILDTYEAERRQVDGGVIDFTRQMTETMEKYADLSPKDRDKLIAQLFTPEDKRLDGDRYSQEIAVDYSGSQLTLAEDNDLTDGPNPGTRSPDAEGLIVGDKPTSLFKLLSGTEYRLLVFCGETGEASDAEIINALASAQRFAPWVKAYVITRDPDLVHGTDAVNVFDQQGAMHRIYAANNPCIYLIRPDGFVAYRSSDVASIDRYFEHIAKFRF